MRTYQTLNKGEIRAVELTIRDKDGQSFTPSGAYAEISKDGGTIVSEQAASINGNKIYITIGLLVTSTIGEYSIYWRILKDSYTYYHITNLTVVEL
jgi:hypothetical protein